MLVDGHGQTGLEETLSTSDFVVALHEPEEVLGLVSLKFPDKGAKLVGLVNGSAGLGDFPDGPEDIGEGDVASDLLLAREEGVHGCSGALFLLDE